MIRRSAEDIAAPRARAAAQDEGGATLLDVLVRALQAAAAYNEHAVVAPAAVLWPDRQGLWQGVVPLLRERIPALVTLGSYDPEARTGPAVWLRCAVARALPETASWPAEQVPVVYLPGVQRDALREVAQCPRSLQPLAELQFRAVWWSRRSGADWTPATFLRDRDAGPGLDVARDRATAAALVRALPALAHEPLASLRGRTLGAADFDALLLGDPERSLLAWLEDPAAVPRDDAARWAAFEAKCKTTYGFDPDADGPQTAAERLAARTGPWDDVWKRFAEAPQRYPRLRAILRRLDPPASDELFCDPLASYPRHNDREETALREALAALRERPRAEACAAVLALERRHGVRRGWVWASCGEAPLAVALQHLAVLADVAQEDLGGSSASAMAQAYAGGAWRADAAVWRALACVERQSAEEQAVIAALRAIYVPWADEAARRLQACVEREGFAPPGPVPPAAGRVPAAGECVLFVDGLRFDVGFALREALEAHEGVEVTLEARWQGLPTVTATGKPAVSPVADRLSAGEPDEAFAPAVGEDGKPLTAQRFRRLLGEAGVEVLERGATGDPDGRAWCEDGNLDHLGHAEGIQLARRIDEEVRALCRRVVSLLQAGWQRVRVVTDHGWLLVPGDLPKVALPACLTKTQWGRCALLKETAAEAPLTVGWRWNPDVRVALPPGIGSFIAGRVYAHGGLSLQECVVPELVVRRSAGGLGGISIGRVQWSGLRCRVEVQGSAPGLRVDVRRKAADARTSLVREPKALGEGGRVTLFVVDDDAEGTSVFVVVVTAGGDVVDQRTTTVGGEG